MPFVTTSAITLDFLPGFSSSPGWLLVTRTRGAWWCHYRGHWRSAIDIFLHGPESAHKNGIVKTFTHTSIPIHPCILLKKERKKKKKKNNKMLNSPKIMLSFTGPLPVRCGGGRRPGILADAPHDCSTSEAFLPTTVLTENLCSCVQQIL